MHEAREKPMRSSALVLVAVQLLTLQPPPFFLPRARVPMHDAHEKPMLSSARGRSSARVPARALQPMHAAKGPRPHVPPAARMREGERKICPPLLLPPPSLLLLLPLAGLMGRSRCSPRGAADAGGRARARPGPAGAAAACDRSLRPAVWPAQRGSAAASRWPSRPAAAGLASGCRPAAAARPAYL